MRRPHPRTSALLGSGLAIAGAALAVPATDLAASTYTLSAQPTIASAFTPATITTGATSALSITITNPSSATLNGLAVTDTLPAGLLVDNPNGQSGTCGSAGTLTATPGTNQITLTGGTLAKGASCTVSADVTAATIGTYTNTTGPVTYTGGTAPGGVTYDAGSSAGNGDTESLNAIGLPTVTIASPKNGAVFTRNQNVKAVYHCTDAAGGPGIVSCSSDAPHPHYVDTYHLGKSELTITAVSADGGVTTQTITYTVTRRARNRRRGVAHRR